MPFLMKTLCVPRIEANLTWMRRLPQGKQRSGQLRLRREARRNQMRENAVSARFVPGVHLFVFDSAVRLPARDPLSYLPSHYTLLSTFTNIAPCLPALTPLFAYANSAICLREVRYMPTRIPLFPMRSPVSAYAQGRRCPRLT